MDPKKETIRRRPREPLPQEVERLFEQADHVLFYNGEYLALENPLDWQLKYNYQGIFYTEKGEIIWQNPYIDAKEQTAVEDLFGMSAKYVVSRYAGEYYKMDSPDEVLDYLNGQSRKWLVVVDKTVKISVWHTEPKTGLIIRSRITLFDTINRKAPTDLFLPEVLIKYSNTLRD